MKDDQDKLNFPLFKVFIGDKIHFISFLYQLKAKHYKSLTKRVEHSCFSFKHMLRKKQINRCSETPKTVEEEDDS